MSNKPLYFAQISDTHIGPRRGYLHRGIDPLVQLEKTLAGIAALPRPPEFVIHSGDVCGDKELHAAAENYALARETFARLNLPIYYLSGNHDETSLLKEHLPMPPVRLLSADPERLAYSFDAKEFRIYALDARTPGKRQGLLPQDQLRALADDMGRSDLELAVFLHYPPLALDADWMDAHMLLENGQDLHAVLAPAAARVRGVFFGHCHQNMQILRDGILYASCASSFFQFRTLPGDGICSVDETLPAGFNFVRFCSGETNLRPRVSA